MSQRQMAALMGVSPRTVGRWLRVGQPGGVQRIPREARDIVNLAFSIHKDLANDRAQRDKLPESDGSTIAMTLQLCNEMGIDFLPNAFAYAQRKPLKNGSFGNRVFIERAEFLDSVTRLNVIAGFVARGQLVTGGYSSDVRLIEYSDGALARKLEELRDSGKRLSKAQLNVIARDSFKKQFPELEIDDRIVTVNTKQKGTAGLNLIDIDPETGEMKGLSYSEAARQILKIEDQYKTRHEASAVRGAHTIILQLRDAYARANQPFTQSKPTGKAGGNRKRKRKT